MKWSNYFIWVSGAYAIYYGFNFLLDSLQASKKATSNAHHYDISSMLSDEDSPIEVGSPVIAPETGDADFTPIGGQGMLVSEFLEKAQQIKKRIF
jgi:hypothetical protein